MKFHPAADIFPLLEGSEFKELVADIKKNGVIDNVIIHEDQILDGRNRYRAAAAAGVTCPMVPWEGQCGDPVSFVISQNIQRRQLTPSQRAMCAARARKLFDEQARERQRAQGGDRKALVANCPQAVQNAGKARDQAGAAFGISGRQVERATKVLKDGIPELAEEVEKGNLSVHKASIISRESTEIQKMAAYNPDIITKLNTQTEDVVSEDASRAEPTVRGKGVRLAHEAVNCLIRIPRNDPLRKRGFQIVTDWIKANQ